MYIEISDAVAQAAIMRRAIDISHYALRQFADRLFSPADLNDITTFDDIARETGIDTGHLLRVFLSGEPLTLQDYLILSDFTGIDPIHDHVTPGIQ